MMVTFKTVYDVSKDAMSVIGTGYMIHKIYTLVDAAVAKIQAVKTALVGTTAVAAVKTVAKS